MECKVKGDESHDFSVFVQSEETMQEKHVIDRQYLYNDTEKKSSFWKKLLLMGEIDERKNKGDLKIEISFILKKKN